MEEGIGGLRHLYMTVFLSGFASLMVIPAITDITMLALCPGQDECSLAIYLSGFQQAVCFFSPILFRFPLPLQFLYININYFILLVNLFFPLPHLIHSLII